MIFTVIPLSSDEAPRFTGLTFPSYRYLLTDPAARKVAVGAYLLDKPIGLALAEAEGTHPSSAEVKSIAVVPPFRQKGLGTMLLKMLERNLTERGVYRVAVSYMSNGVSTTAIERILQECKWPQACPRRLYCKTSWSKVAQAPWLNAQSLPPGYGVFRWAELTDDDRFQIQQGHLNHPPALDPLKLKLPFHRPTSLGLRFRERIVGWSVTECYQEDTVRFSRLFVRRNLQPLGRGVQLLAHSIRQLENSLEKNAICDVDIRNDAMIRFFERRLKPFVDSTWMSRRSVKHLGTPQGKAQD